MTKANTKKTAPQAKELTVERMFNASPEKLWAYWTDPQKYARWLNPAPGIDLVIHEFDVRPGGHIRFDMPQPDGDKNPQDGIFHTLKPYREIVSGAPDKSFLIRVRFEAVGTRTRMTVTVTGVPPEYHEGATQGWNAGFQKLAALLTVEGRAIDPKSSPRGFAIERILKAPPRKVWTMWTTKDGLEAWFTGRDWTSKVTHLDVRVGGKYVITMTDGKQTIRNHGTYTEVVPNRRLAYTWEYDIFLSPAEKPYDVPITVEFEEIPGGTKMRFTQGPLATPEYTEGSRQGVLANFERLAKSLEV